MEHFDIKDGVLIKYTGVLGNVIIPDGVTAIAKEAFFYGTSTESSRSLKKVTIPNSVKSIGFRAFCLCANLENINIPESVTDMGNRIFDQCKSLKNITFPHAAKDPSGDLVLSNGMFAGCDSLENFIIPDGTEIIGDSAFGSCKNLKHVTIPNSVTFIRERAFDFCGSLAEIYIPKSVQGIDNNVFSGCNSLKRIYYGGANMDEWDSLKRGKRPIQSKKMVVYFYAESKPANEGNYWHFNDSGKPVAWEK
jgi:hypothetical protein